MTSLQRYHLRFEFYTEVSMYVGKTLRRRGLFVFAISSILIVTVSAQNYKLAGAGSSEVNGIYFHTGATYGELSRPKYQKAGTGTTVYVYNAQYSVDLSYYWNIDNDLDDENDSYYYWNGAFDGTPTTFPVTGASPNNWSNTGAGFGIGTTPISTQLTIVTPTFTNGSSFTPVKVTSGATNYVIGRFQLQGNAEGAVLQAVTISLAGTRSGITAVKLWSSSDATLQ